MTFLWVTGTDTGVGKTALSCALLRCLAERGLWVAPVKLVETGCEDLRCPADALSLAEASWTEDLALVAPWRFSLAAAPSTAARAEGQSLSPERLLAHLQKVREGGFPVLWEGAGGALVPLTDTCLQADLAALACPMVLLVAHHRLGTLNHTLLTVEALERRGLSLLAVVFNQVTPPDPVSIEHAREFQRLRPDLAVFGPAPRCPPDNLALLSVWVEQSGLVQRVARALQP
ncbi:MAG: dethiobiotin synthase [Deltaproteobacteria bacterium]|nr:dethiobiotin synthase [Deltaproteobacteria bacterium]